MYVNHIPNPFTHIWDCTSDHYLSHDLSQSPNHTSLKVVLLLLRGNSSTNCESKINARKPQPIDIMISCPCPQVLLSSTMLYRALVKNWISARLDRIRISLQTPNTTSMSASQLAMDHFMSFGITMAQNLHATPSNSVII